MNNTLPKLIEVMKTSMPETDMTQVTRETRLQEDLGVDSLNALLLAIVIEDNFHISFGQDFKAGTVGELCDYIEKQAAK